MSAVPDGAWQAAAEQAGWYSPLAAIMAVDASVDAWMVFVSRQARALLGEGAGPLLEALTTVYGLPLDAKSTRGLPDASSAGDVAGPWQSESGQQ